MMYITNDKYRVQWLRPCVTTSSMPGYLLASITAKIVGNNLVSHSCKFAGTIFVLKSITAKIQKYPAMELWGQVTVQSAVIEFEFDGVYRAPENNKERV